MSPGVGWLAHGAGFVFGLLTAALVILLLLSLDSWHRCGCLLCCMPRNGYSCKKGGGPKIPE